MRRSLCCERISGTKRPVPPIRVLCHEYQTSPEGEFDKNNVNLRLGPAFRVMTS